MGKKPQCAGIIIAKKEEEDTSGSKIKPGKTNNWICGMGWVGAWRIDFGASLDFPWKIPLYCRVFC